MPDVSLTTLLDRRAMFLAFVERRVGERALAEDLLQSAYMRAVQHKGRPAAKDSAIAWFYAVLRHAVIDFYRRRASEAKTIEPWRAELETSVPSPLAAQTFGCGCIAHVLPGMKPSYAEVLREVDLGEGSLKDFAARHRITEGNAAVRVHRARIALRRALVSFCGACSFQSCLDCICTSAEVPCVAAKVTA